jgi:predicted acylesterase/phospholipase RssA
LSKKTGVNLYVCAINLNKNEEVIFSVDNTPNISVFDAVRASITLPLYIKPLKIEGEYYIDGGIKNNFPINVFSNVPKDNILGIMIRIDNEYEPTIIAKNTDMTFFEYFSQIYNLISLEIIKNSIDKYVNKDQKNIIVINQSHKTNWLDIKITNEGILKNISDEDIDIFIIQGYTAIYNYAKTLSK